MWVALLLWHCRGLYDAPFSNKRLKRFGIDRRMKARALRKLEELGLIAIERRGKRNPRVALLDVGE
jgi:DNA-binding HxlR family transcriptional regulator